MGSKNISYTTIKDERTDASSMSGGQLAGPGSLVTNPGSIGARGGDYSTVTQDFTGSKFRMGMTGQEVKALLGEQTALFGQQVSQVADFGKAALNAVTTGKAETGSLASLKDVVPLMIVGVIVVAAIKSRRH